MLNVAAKPNVLFIDIETFANHARAWGGRTYEVNLIKIDKVGGMASFAYQWHGSKKIECLTREGLRSDKPLVKELGKILNQADVVIAQNGKKFDMRHWNARMLKYGLNPPAPYDFIDTLREARKHFYLDSYSLDSVADYLGVGRKLKHRGFDMWEGCEQDDPKAWREMVRYNKHDVALLAEVYERMAPWIRSYSAGSSEVPECPRPTCPGEKFRSLGIRKGHRRYQCLSCGGATQARLKEPGYKQSRLKAI